MNALAVMAREPVAGRVKTRLAPELSHEDAAALYEAFLKDTLELAGSCPGVTPVVAYTPDEAGEYFHRITTKNVLLLPQRGGDLGVRLEHVASELFFLGFSRVVIMGSDSPDLPRDYLEMAFDRLYDHDLVIGPCDDGGYYLIGTRAPAPPVFHGIPWSSPGVFESTLRNAESMGMRIAVLPRWHDVDTIEDLRGLIAAPRGKGWEHTEKMLDTLDVSGASRRDPPSK